MQGVLRNYGSVVFGQTNFFFFWPNVSLYVPLSLFSCKQYYNTGFSAVIQPYLYCITAAAAKICYYTTFSLTWKRDCRRTRNCINLCAKHGRLHRDCVTPREWTQCKLHDSHMLLCTEIFSWCGIFLAGILNIGIHKDRASAVTHHWTAYYYSSTSHLALARHNIMKLPLAFLCTCITALPCLCVYCMLRECVGWVCGGVCVCYQPSTSSQQYKDTILLDANDQIFMLLTFCTLTSIYTQNNIHPLQSSHAESSLKKFTLNGTKNWYILGEKWI